MRIRYIRPLADDRAIHHWLIRVQSWPATLWGVCAMRDDESSYYERRAEQALDQAQRAIHPAAVKAHYQMAELYLERMLECRAHVRRFAERGLFDHWNKAAVGH